MQGSDIATCISWNPSRFEEPTLVTGCRDGSIKIWQYNSNFRKWQMLPINLTGHTGPIHDISWAPNMGRSYHLIASASKDGTARIWKLNLPKPQSETTTTSKKPVPQQQVSFKVLSDHQAEVWRVEWNLIGSVLATSGDDGAVRVWKYQIESKDWQMESVIRSNDLHTNDVDRQ
jgi:nucleoporin SEH1